MQMSGSKIGISCAIERFSYFAVPVGKTPSTGSADTGNRSPSPASSCAMTRFTNSGALSGTRCSRRTVAVTVSGISTWWRAASDASIAAKFRSTIALPRAAYVFSSAALMKPIACSVGRTPESAKKHGCITVFTRLPISRLAGDALCVDDPHVDALGDELALDLHREVVPDLIGAPRAVQQEGRPRARVLEHLQVLEQSELVASDEVGVVDEVGRADRRGTEPKVRHRDRARLLRVVDEVALSEPVGLLADDLDRRLVRSDRAVRAQTEEHRLHFALRAGVAHSPIGLQRQARDVVVDADGEVHLRLRSRPARRTRPRRGMG